MPLILAKTAGFCFGVRRAVEMTRALLREGKSVSLLGQLIHNKEIARELQACGAVTVESPSQCRPGDTVVVRAHGVSKETMEEIQALGLACCDATCPFVKKIHTLVAEHSAPEIPTVIAGDPAHPEVIGIRSFAKGGAWVIRNAAELDQLLQAHPEWREKQVLGVAQTTFHAEEWEKSIKNSFSLCTNAIFFDTICNATLMRQKEACALAANCEAMLIIGDRTSSNTAKLKSVCEDCCPSFLVEGKEELRRHAGALVRLRTIGCTAGASTPAHTIKEVLNAMADLIQNENPSLSTEPEGVSAPALTEEREVLSAEAPVEETTAAEGTPAEETTVEEATASVAPATEEEEFTAALEESLKGMNTDQKVRGYVTAVNPSELQVDIGRKQTGYVAADEYSNDPTVDMTKEVHVGDTLDLIILKTNDMEGTVQLSKKRYDASKAWTSIIQAEEDGSVLEGKVVDVIKGGVLAVTSGVRVFIPGSLSGVPRNAPLDGLLHQTVQFRIIEVNKPRRRAVGSIRAVTQEARKTAEDAFWGQAEVGQTYHGTVKSLVSYGAFVDIGGLDGMVHISELSWSRIKDPSEVVAVGDEIDVYIKALDFEKHKISLGYKKAEDSPWEMLRKEYPVGTVAQAKIVSFTSFGAFARILPGVDGLIHISQIADRRIEKPQDALQIGETVTVKVVGIDFEKQRVSLSIRALSEGDEDEAAPEEEHEQDEVVASSASEED
ncbi:MAG: bifunctional 4-hydroxy-3-methylbut-2-enyl diphosphate reductase/30S ribosomal protein S1 [Oscillospiraceae bacterium]|jgi:4-hydroxy-3-methylbut-2-enyl diphosphate reductase|nr:bifunctional 4-hydroxy-3-methylbut-2-enyl diphosphate reductase/30S ribosomal protein S1 [Oscillospiraceae bacterium]